MQNSPTEPTQYLDMLAFICSPSPKSLCLFSMAIALCHTCHANPGINIWTWMSCSPGGEKSLAKHMARAAHTEGHSNRWSSYHKLKGTVAFTYLCHYNSQVWKIICMYEILQSSLHSSLNQLLSILSFFCHLPRITNQLIQQSQSSHCFSTRDYTK